MNTWDKKIWLSKPNLKADQSRRCSLAGAAFRRLQSLNKTYQHTKPKAITFNQYIFPVLINATETCFFNNIIVYKLQMTQRAMDYVEYSTLSSVTAYLLMKDDQKNICNPKDYYVVMELGRILVNGTRTKLLNGDQEQIKEIEADLKSDVLITWSEHLVTNGSKNREQRCINIPKVILDPTMDGTADNDYDDSMYL